MSQPAVNTPLHVVVGLPHNVPAYLPVNIPADVSFHFPVGKPVNSFQSQGGSHNYDSNNNDYGNNNGYESHHYGTNDNGYGNNQHGNTGFGSHYDLISITFSKKPFLGKNFVN